MVPAGRRSGKTEIAKRKLVMELWDCFRHPRPWDDPNYFAAAPTRDQAKRIWWKDLKALTPKAWIREISETELRITTHWGASLWVIGLDRAERMEGTPWDGGVVDELANCKPGIWDANIRPALSTDDRRGWCWQIGVPDMDAPGQVEYFERYEMARSGQDPDWSAFTWPSADIVAPEEVESARRSMPPQIFRQEFGGEFVKPGGLAFPDFDVAVHTCRTRAAYEPSLPLGWSLDFNINPMCSGIIQHHKGEVRVIDELTLPDTKTDVACTAFLERAAANHWNLTNLCIYGDATGSARDTTSGLSDWAIIRNRLKNLSPRIKVPAANPGIKDTVNAVNGRLLNAAGEVNLVIHPQCTELIKGLRSAIWPSDLEEWHALAWLRYFTHWEYPIRIERASGGQIAVSN